MRESKANNMNWALLKAIKDRGLTQRDFARLVNENESIVSRVINGIWNPDRTRQLRYAKVLKKSVKSLF